LKRIPVQFLELIGDHKEFTFESDSDDE
jgi:hypothetical protein